MRHMSALMSNASVDVPEEGDRDWVARRQKDGVANPEDGSRFVQSSSDSQQLVSAKHW